MEPVEEHAILWKADPSRLAGAGASASVSKLRRYRYEIVSLKSIQQLQHRIGGARRVVTGRKTNKQFLSSPRIMDFVVRVTPSVARRPTLLLYSRVASMAERSSRPFYGEFAWAFDLLIDRPVAKECAAIAAWLVARGVVPGARLLDAGCGTGRYAIELGRRGYVVEGIDRSSELIDVAKRSAIDHPGSISFHVGDLLALPDQRYDAILCRGVLNDVVDTGSRQQAFSSFAGALRRGGVLILDVREWEATKDRKQREPLFRKSVDTNRGKLTFTSVTELDPERQQLLLSETHTLVNDAGEHSSDYRFVMRCWTRTELESLFERVGLGSAEYFGAYDPAIPAGATDRLIAVTQLSDASQLQPF